MYFVYIIRSEKNGLYYIGCTDNLERRISEHNRKLSKYTKLYVPWKLQYSEQFETLSEARTRESQIKKWKKRSVIERLISSHRLAA